jgi:glycosyltransferase involved in cell wall biosynthesis
MHAKSELTIVIPAKNEAAGLALVLPKIRALYPAAEIIVVDDGSADSTRAVCLENQARCISHPVSLGNGAAIKTGARAARGEVLVFMDADGQHKPEDIPRLLGKLTGAYDMIVGARSYASQAGAHRAVANSLYNWFASWMVGMRIDDLTSGFRAVNARKFRQFLYLLPNGFSYPTTITMSFFRAGYSVAYLPIEAPPRIGQSHVRLLRDGARFFLIIFKIGTLFAPLKLFLPISAAFFFTGLGYYTYTFLTVHRFTNMSATLFITAVLVFLMGLLSEQISALNYKDSNADDHHAPVPDESSIASRDHSYAGDKD